MLPVHSACPCFQWALTDQMALDPVDIYRPKQSYGIVAAERVVHVVPIMPMGKLPSVLNKHTLALAKRLYMQRERRRDPTRALSAYWPWKQIRPGELFMLNVHAYDGQE